MGGAHAEFDQSRVLESVYPGRALVSMLGTRNRLMQACRIGFHFDQNKLLFVHHELTKTNQFRASTLENVEYHGFVLEQLRGQSLPQRLRSDLE